MDASPPQKSPGALNLLESADSEIMGWLRHYCLEGRPVLIAGTAFKAAKNATSVIAANALTPARINSLFLTELDSLPARCFRSSSTVYSALGMVKLSRTSLGFFALTAF